MLKDTKSGIFHAEEKLSSRNVGTIYRSWDANMNKRADFWHDFKYVRLNIYRFLKVAYFSACQDWFHNILAQCPGTVTL